MYSGCATVTRYVLGILCIILIIYGAVCGFLLNYNIEVKYGKPVVSYEELNLYHEPFQKVLDDGTFVYVMYGRHTGVIQVYDQKGTYQHTLYFYEHMNGAFDMTMDEKFVYLMDMKHNLYVLQSGQCIDFIENERCNQLIESLDFEVTSMNYEIRFGSIWDISGNDTICIVYRPEWHLFFQYGGYIVLILFFVILISNRRKRKRVIHRG